MIVLFINFKLVYNKYNDKKTESFQSLHGTFVQNFK